MSPFNPRPHLLMEIVVKQDQVEVLLQAPQRLLPDTVLAVASLREKNQEGERGGKDGAARATQSPPQEGQELSLRNPQKTICSPLITQFCQAESSSRHLTLPHLRQTSPWFRESYGDYNRHSSFWCRDCLPHRL